MAQYKDGDPGIAEAAAAQKYGTFDDYLAKHENGDFGDVDDPKSWAAMIEAYGQRTNTVLGTGATALTGVRAQEQATIAGNIAAVDDARTQRLVDELLGDLVKFETGE